jgi:hypothetical protein
MYLVSNCAPVFNELPLPPNLMAKELELRAILDRRMVSKVIPLSRTSLSAEAAKNGVSSQEGENLYLIFHEIPELAYQCDKCKRALGRRVHAWVWAEARVSLGSDV